MAVDLKELVTQNTKILDRVNGMIYGLSAQTIKTETFIYLTEMLAAYECDLYHTANYGGEEVDIKASVSVINSKDYLEEIVLKIMNDNNLNLVDRNIYIFLSFTAFEVLSLSINASLFDESFEDEEMEYILFGNIYNRDLSRILVYNPSTLSYQDLMEQYAKRFVNEYKDDIEQMHNVMYKDGGSGDFIGWTTNVVDAVFDLNTNKIDISRLLILADYYVLIIDETKSLTRIPKNEL